MNIIFFSLFDCLIECQNEQVELFKNNFLVLNFEGDKNIVKVLPKNADSMTYYFTLNIKNICTDNFLAKVMHDSQRCFLFLFPCYEQPPSKTLSTQNCDYQIACDGGSLVQAGEKAILHKKICAKNIEIYEKFNLIFCELDYGKNKNLIVIDGANNIILDQQINQIEFSVSGFSTLTTFNDMLGLGSVKKYDVENSQLKLMQEYAVFCNKKAKMPYSDCLNPLAFFECVRAKSITLTKNFCTPVLASKLSGTSFNYFDNFDQIYFDLNIPQNITLICTQKQTCESYLVSVKNNFVDNIQKI